MASLPAVADGASRPPRQGRADWLARNRWCPQQLLQQQQQQQQLQQQRQQQQQLHNCRAFVHLYHVVLALVACVAVLCRQPACCHAQKLANLISNPSFESTTAAAGTVVSFTSDDPNPLRGGWTVSWQNYAVSLYANRAAAQGGPVAFHGVNGVLLGRSCTENGGYDCSRGTLYQSFATTSGMEYTLTLKITGEATSVDGFDTAMLGLVVADVGERAASELDDPNELDWLLSRSDDSAYSIAVSPSTTEGNRLAWVQVGPIAFTARSSRTVLYLTGGSVYGHPAVFVDMVEVLPLPSPIAGAPQSFMWPIALSDLYLSGSALYLVRSRAPLLQLTAKAADNNGLAVVNSPFFLMNNGWADDGQATCTPLSFNITLVYTSDRGGGAGLAVVLTSDPSLGATGKNLGYARRQLGQQDNEVRVWGTMAAELDAVRDPDVGDISSSHVGLNLHARGKPVVPRSTMASDTSTAEVGQLYDGLNRTVWLQYDSNSTTMFVYLARTLRKPNNPAGDRPAWPVLSLQFDPCDVFQDANVPVYVGIAGATTPSRQARQTVLLFSVAVAAANTRVPSPPPSPPPPASPPPISWDPSSPDSDSFVRVNARDALGLTLAALDWDLDFYRVDSWQIRNPCLDWEGVECDDNGNVIGLRSSTQYLQGPLSVHLSVLTSLTTLELWGNSFTTGIPTEWSTLTNLIELDLSDSNVDAELRLSPLTAMTKLTVLKLSSNYFSGSMPDVFSALQGLEKVDLCNNELTGQIPSSIVSLTNLTFLSLCDNNLFGRVPASVQNLPNLAVLDVSNNYLSGAIPTAFVSPALADGSQSRFMAFDDNYFTGSATIQVNGQPICLPQYNADEDPFNNNDWAPSPAPAAAQAPAPTPASAPAPAPAPATTAGGNGRRLLSQTPMSLSGEEKEAMIARRDRMLMPIVLRRGRELRVSSSYDANDVSSLRLNCLTYDSTYPSTCEQEEQKDRTIECNWFCGANGPQGPCNGNGVCYLDGPSQVPTCLCDDGWTHAPGNQTDCSVKGAASAPPPPPPADSVAGLTAGLAFQDVVLQRKNQWSRYLSRGFTLKGGKRPVWNIQSSTNWTLDYNPDLAFPPALDQGPCGLCWAIATVDAISSAVVVARNTSLPPATTTGGYHPLSLAQLVECQQGLSTSTDVCVGGFPNAGLELATQSGLVPPASYPTTVADFSGSGTTGRSCKPTSQGSVPEKLVTYEEVQFNGWFGMLLTLQNQPVIATLQSSAFTFRTYSGGFVYNDPSCYTNSLDHVVLVVGYQLVAAVPFWIVRNSWGPTWGNNGYMSLALQGGDGVCGINVLPALYPIPAPAPNDPCYEKGLRDSDRAVMNPCGGGKCIPATGLSYTCACPDGFVNVPNTVTLAVTTTESCVPVDACGLSSFNPCVVGSCVNDMKGGYSCLCPPGYITSTLTKGGATCVFANPGTPTGMMSYTIQPGVTCYTIYTSYGLTEKQFLDQNPGLNCTANNVNRTVNVANDVFKGCNVTFLTTADTANCTTIATLFGVTEKSLADANPGLNCATLSKGQQLCVLRGNWTPPADCTTPYQVRKSDTCQSIIAFTRQMTWMQFFRLNPGINCDLINPPTDIDTPGLKVCLASEPLAAKVCKYGNYRPVRLGDTCASLTSSLYFNKPVLQFQCNGVCINSGLFIGKPLCKPNAARSCL